MSNIKTHPQLLEESFMLEDEIEILKQKNDLINLEKSLIRIIEVYESLNYCEEDDYLENIIDCYVDLCEINKENKSKLINFYEKIVENYDFLIQRDKNEQKLLHRHVKNLNEIIKLYSSLNPTNHLTKLYPRIKKYIL